MNPDFWQKRWQTNEIAFHQGNINAHLQRFWRRLDVEPGQTVFVPLAGKSLDMRWLAERGYTVLGVEISALAVGAFFSENGYRPTIIQQEFFQVWQADNITLLCGDFFDLGRAHLESAAGTYDRASLIALPPAMRQRYARHLMDILPSATGILLVSLEYDPGEMDGPPFPVTESEVKDLYGAYYDIDRLYAHDALAENPRFQKKGLSRLDEKVYLLTRRR